MYFGYSVGLFDILGFEQKLANIGLSKMVERYEALVEGVNRRNRCMNQLFSELGFEEAPYLTGEKDVVVLSKTQGAYASDAILLWANRTWPEVRDKHADKFKRLSKDPACGWKFHPIPCDNFLNDCNELICRGIEVGLPFRGAVSMGDAVFDEEKRIFLGQPIIETARLEKQQKFIGASLCEAFVNQVIPKCFILEFDKHLKEDCGEQWGGFVLDWPRHWRKTRGNNVSQVINAMNTKSKYSACYENTLDLVAYSNKFAEQFESRKDTSVRSVYDEFSFSNDKLSVKVRRVRQSK